MGIFKELFGLLPVSPTTIIKTWLIVVGSEVLVPPVPEGIRLIEIWLWVAVVIISIPIAPPVTIPIVATVIALPVTIPMAGPMRIVTTAIPGTKAICIIVVAFEILSLCLRYT